MGWLKRIFVRDTRLEEELLNTRLDLAATKQRLTVALISLHGYRYAYGEQQKKIEEHAKIASRMLAKLNDVGKK